MAKTLEDDFTQIKGVIRLMGGGKPFTDVQEEEMRTLYFAGVYAVMIRLRSAGTESMPPGVTRETLDIKKVIQAVFTELQTLEHEIAAELKETLIKALESVTKPK